MGVFLLVMKSFVLIVLSLSALGSEAHLSSLSNEASTSNILVSSSISSLSSMLSTNTDVVTSNSSSSDEIFGQLSQSVSPVPSSSSDQYSLMPRPSQNPQMSQLAQRLSQPLAPINRPGPPNSPQQLMNLLQRPISSVGEGMLVTQMSGTPLSTIKVWVPGTGHVQVSQGPTWLFESNKGL